MSPELLQNHLGIALPSPLHVFEPDWPGAERVNIWVKRDDLIHPIISGNKWRKLSGLLQQRAGMNDHIVSFGGGFSNHLHALGWCCHQLGIQFTALVRGDYSATPTPMLLDLHQWQADIRYLTKLEYQRRHDADYISELTQHYPNAAIIPEGGSEQAALTGIKAMLSECEIPIDHIVTPVASGATMAGIIAGSQETQHILGIAVLNGVGYLERLVAQFLSDKSNRRWQILHQFHHGGYARNTPALLEVCREMQDCYGIPVEPVYSGKVFFAIKQLLAEAYFPAGHNIMVIHTGGLQGARTDPQDASTRYQL